MNKEEIIELLILFNSRLPHLDFLKLAGYLKKGQTDSLENALTSILFLYNQIIPSLIVKDQYKEELKEIIKYFYPIYLGEKLNGTFDHWVSRERLFSRYESIMKEIEQKVS